MVNRCEFENSQDIGAYAKLTNRFCLLPYMEASNSLNVIAEDCADDLMIIHMSVAETPIVGRLAIANSHGVVLPHTAKKHEIDHLKEELPDGVEVSVVTEPFSALGNVVSCNDSIALVHPGLDEETIEIIRDTLQVEVHKCSIGDDGLVGSYSVFTNLGGVVAPTTPPEEIEQLISMFGINIETCTVNQGSNVVSSGICVNDKHLFCGMKTTSHETAALCRIFKTGEHLEIAQDPFFNV